MILFAGFTAALYLIFGRIDIAEEIIQGTVNLNVYIDGVVYSLLRLKPIRHRAISGYVLSLVYSLLFWII